MEAQARLLDGYYKCHDSFAQHWRVAGDKLDMRDAFDSFNFNASFEYGDFGPASDKVAEVVGPRHYNLRVTYYMGSAAPLEDLGVITEGGARVQLKGLSVYSVEKITDQQFEEMQNDYDPIEAPPGPYKLQPEKKGKLLWLSGASGMGKSTSAQLLARNHGYVYYEADAFAMMLNPFVDLHDDNPSMATAKQRILKGPGDAKRAALVKKCNEVWGPLMAGEEYDKQTLADYFAELSRDIAAQKQRVGGDWAVATVVFSREIRDMMREILGPDLVFIHLKMSKEDQHKRLMERHDGNEEFVQQMEDFEKILARGGDDTDMTHLLVTAEMTRDQVAREVLNIAAKVE